MTGRIRLVGGVAIESDTDRLEGGVIAAARSRRILAALVDASGNISARRLAERVWAEPPSTWPNALRGAIATLRAAVDGIGLGGSGLIVTTASGWALAPGISTDLGDAEQAVEAAETALGAGAARPGLRLRSELRGMLEGSLLDGDDAEWLEGLRERHRRLVDRTRHVIGGAALSAERPEIALEQAELLLAQSAVDETAHRLLIRARRAAGDRAGAIEAFERCRGVLSEQLGIDPSVETVAIYLDALQSGSSSSGSLPALPTDGFFGRAAEVSAVTAALREPGVVEVIGRGGVGKSRLALQAAHEITSAEGGRFWASLGDLTASELVAVTVAEAIGASASSDPVAAIVDGLAPIGPALLVLDGCEEVADGALELVARLRESVPNLRLLITTRVPVSSGGTRVPLGALSATEGGLGRSPAVRLVLDRVAARGGRLRLDDATAAALEELCHRCEGLPLALELAAAQLVGMAVADVLDGLRDAVDGVGGVLGSMLGQARDALDAEELAVVDRLALVDGRVPLALVRGLVADAVAPGRAARLLARLDESGLLTVDHSRARWRYGLDDEVRRMLRPGVPAQRTAYGGLADALDAVAPADATAAPAGYRDAVDDAADGFRTLFRAAEEGFVERERALDLAYRLHRYWSVTRMSEGRFWLGRLLDGADTGIVAARARFAAGYLGYWAADPAALTLLRVASDQLRTESPAIAARARMYAAGLADDLDLVDEARDDALESVELARLSGSLGLIAATTNGVGAVLAERGDPEAVDYCRVAIAVLDDDTPEDQRWAMLANAARLAWQVGDAATARDWAQRSRRLLDGPARIAQVQLAGALAALELADGRLDEAIAAADLAVSAADDLELNRETPLMLAIRSRVHLRRGEPGPAAEDSRRALELARSVRVAAAIALETAAAVLEDRGDTRAAILVRSAAAWRSSTRRPAPVSLRMPDPGPGDSLPVDEAIERAIAVLGE